jgi:hypothetical protein
MNPDPIRNTFNLFVYYGNVFDESKLEIELSMKFVKFSRNLQIFKSKLEFELGMKFVKFAQNLKMFNSPLGSLTPHVNFTLLLSRLKCVRCLSMKRYFRFKMEYLIAIHYRTRENGSPWINN